MKNHLAKGKDETVSFPRKEAFVSARLIHSPIPIEFLCSTALLHVSSVNQEQDFGPAKSLFFFSFSYYLFH